VLHLAVAGAGHGGIGGGGGRGGAGSGRGALAGVVAFAAAVGGAEEEVVDGEIGRQVEVEPVVAGESAEREVAAGEGEVRVEEVRRVVAEVERGGVEERRLRHG